MRYGPCRTTMAPTHIFSQVARELAAAEVLQVAYAEVESLRARLAPPKQAVAEAPPNQAVAEAAEDTDSGDSDQGAAASTTAADGLGGDRAVTDSTCTDGEDEDDGRATANTRDINHGEEAGTSDGAKPRTTQHEGPPGVGAIGSNGQPLVTAFATAASCDGPSSGNVVSYNGRTAQLAPGPQAPPPGAGVPGPPGVQPSAAAARKAFGGDV